MFRYVIIINMKQPRQTQIINRRAGFEYEILEKLEAGLVLSGTEVKSLRAGKVQIEDGFVSFSEGEAWLTNVTIAPFEQGNRANHEPGQRRKLLLHKNEIAHLYAARREKGLSVIVCRLYFNRGRVKIELALGRGKKLYDKRATIAEREADRSLARVRKGDLRD